MQSYVEITENHTLKESLPLLNGNLATALSQSAGVAFPVANLKEGMPCARLDTRKLYVLTDSVAKTWKEYFDFGTGRAPDSTNLAGQAATYYRNAANLNAGTLAVARLAGTYNIGILGNAATATKLATPRAINGVNFDGSAAITIKDATKLNLTGGVLTGAIGATELAVTGADGEGKGLSLYGGAKGGAPDYGMMFAKIASFGAHGGVASDWATYFTMSGAVTRGWIFKSGKALGGNVASISAEGVITAADMKIGANKVWHAGNDGAGSGLDADLLDGKDGTYYLAWANQAGKPATATRWPTFAEVSGKPATFTPSAHKHPVSQITGLGNAATRNVGTATGQVMDGADSRILNLLGNSDSDKGDPNLINANSITYSRGTQDTGLFQDGAIYAQFYAPTTWGHQIFGDYRSGSLAVRGLNNTKWTPWRKIWDSGNAPVTATRWPTFAEVTGKPATFTPAAHKHAWGDITGKPATFTPAAHSHAWGDITGKPATFTPSGHKHPWADVTGQPATATRWPTWAEVTGKPATMAPSAHKHPWADVTGAPAQATRWPTWAEVTGKPGTMTPSAHTHGGHDVRTLGHRLTVDSDGKVHANNTAYRRAGMYGFYDSAKISHIWSMGAAYVIDANGANFGTLYGLAYKHTNNATGGAMAGGHQMVWCQNGAPKAAMGDNIWTAGNVTAYSDIRLKTNIELIGGALRKVQSLRGVTYLRKDLGITQAGLIAQEVLEVLPEVVTGGPTKEDPDGMYSVAYGNMIGLLVEAIKELKGEVDALRKEAA